MQRMSVAIKKEPLRIRYNTEKLPCPVCGGRVIDGRRGIKSKLYNMECADELEIDFFSKCSKCGKDIGIKKI